MKKVLSSLILIIIGCVAQAQIPTNYYNGTNGLVGLALKNKLNTIIDGHTKLSYSLVWDALKTTDEDPNNSANVILLYTGNTKSKTQNGGGVNDWNREHVWAKSHGGFGTSTGAGTDIHHLRPTNVQVNSSRGSLDFDNGGTAHSIATGCKFDSDSWEPRDEVKGDVARMLFYMATRYEGANGEPDLELNYKVSNGSIPYHGKLNILLQWHNQDTVDAFERRRNDSAYSIQGNRNPYIDHPNFANMVFDTNYVANNVVLPEPGNNVTNFTRLHSVHLLWNNSTSGNLADGYLVKWSDVGFSAIVDPIDGTDETDIINSTNHSSLTIDNFKGCKKYYFKVFSYANDKGNIDYKTTGTTPEISYTTPCN